MLQNIKKMMTFHQTDLDQAVHCCNLLAMVVTGELHVTDGGIWSKRLLMYNEWSLKNFSDCSKKALQRQQCFLFFPNTLFINNLSVLIGL